jgi:hypothetical protein
MNRRSHRAARAILALSLIATAPLEAAAACVFNRQVQGRINQLITGPIFDGDVVLVLAGMDVISGSEPACSTQSNRFRFNAGGDEGRLTYSTALAAYLGERRITLVGCGECTLNGNTEDLRWIRLD